MHAILPHIGLDTCIRLADTQRDFTRMRLRYRHQLAGKLARLAVRLRSFYTFLYQLVKEYFPAFSVNFAAKRTCVPKHVEQDLKNSSSAIASSMAF